MTTLALIVLALLIVVILLATLHGIYEGNPFVIFWWCFGGCQFLTSLLGACFSGILSANE